MYRVKARFYRRVPSFSGKGNKFCRQKRRKMTEKSHRESRCCPLMGAALSVVYSGVIWSDVSELIYVDVILYMFTNPIFFSVSEL